jgi:hypothetical protein
MSVAAAAAALGSLEVMVCGMAPASEVIRSVVLALGERVLPFDISGLAAGTGDGRLGGPPLVAEARDVPLAFIELRSEVCLHVG